MDKVFRRWVEEVGVGPVEAAIVCAATPAESVGRPDLGRLVPGTPADVVVLDRAFDVRRTFLNGVPAF
jgi:N-acetylglucosamine-6-phosphate deacetylase